jgi:hypothetical protein
MRNTLVMRVSWLAFCIFMTGCGQAYETHEVEGTLHYGGMPLDSVQVIFIPEGTEGSVGPRSTGITDENGHFKLMTEDGKSVGAVAGKHSIILHDLKGISPALENSGVMKRLNDQRPDPNRPISTPGLRERPSNKGVGRPVARIPAHFTDLARTPLKREVQPGKQIIDLELTVRE